MLEKIFLHVSLLLSFAQRVWAQDYVEICDCKRGVEGVCIDYLDSNWQAVSREKARWYYYNYSFGKYRFFDWSWRKNFVRKNQLTTTDTSVNIAGQPKPLHGKYYWSERGSQTIIIEQSFENGWPCGQTKAYSKKGYVLECLDFESPYNRGKFSMMCHLYHKGKLDYQCVFALDPTQKKSYAIDVSWKMNEPPTTIGIFPKFQRSLLLDLRGLEHKHITATQMPCLFHLMEESCYSASAEPISYLDGTSGNVMNLYTKALGWRVNQLYTDAMYASEISQTHTTADIFTDDDDGILMKMCRSSLRENEVKHLLLSLDTIQNAINLYGDTSHILKETLLFADRCVNQLMQYMRLNTRELDWSCVMITSSSSKSDKVPWLLWGEGVRSNYKIEQVSAKQALNTFAHFAHITLCDSDQAGYIKDCNSARWKRK